MMSKKQIFGILALIIGLSSSISYAAKIQINQGMKVGDSAGYINPLDLLSADNTDNNQVLKNPNLKAPDKRISFELKQSFRLRRIVLKNSSDIDNRLYFVIWDENENVVVNTISKTKRKQFNQSLKFNKQLDAGKYKIAIASQCRTRFLNISLGWSDPCSFLFFPGNWDDFSYRKIQLNGKKIKSKVNHYRIIHPTSALTCDSESITVQACSNAPNAKSCKLTTGKNITINKNNKKWKTVNLSSGSAVVTGLESSSPELVSLSLKNLATYCNGSANNKNCEVDFKDLGLKLSSLSDKNQDIPNQIAGKDIDNLYLRALKNDGSGTCEALDVPSASFDLAADCINPGSCGNALPFKVGNQELGKDQNSSSINLTKVSTGVFKLDQASYGDAGQIQLTAQYKFSDGTPAVGSSNIFTVRPDRFLPQAINDKGQSLLERSGSGLKNTQVAGETFSFEVRAVNAQGQDTINYVASNSMQMKVTRSTPNGNTGFEGEFTYADNKSLSSELSPAWQGVKLALFSNGISSNKVNYSEVGAIKINVQDTDYYGQTIMMDGIGQDSAGFEIGRFIPAKFEMTVGEVNNYIDTGDVRFTYMGQENLGFKYKVEARNAQGSITKNYDGNALYDGSNKQAEVLFYGESDGLNLQDRLTGFAGKWCDGVYQSGSCGDNTVDLGQFIRNSDGKPDGPFINLYYGLSIVDRDGVELAGTDMSFNSVATAKRFSNDKSEVRYGRINLLDGYGPADQDYAIGANLEYFNGLDFIKNTDDNLTLYSLGLMSVTDPDDGLPLKGGDVKFNAGYSQAITLGSPVNSGDVEIEYAGPDWLKNGSDNPEATISFGFFRGNDRVIYRRRLN